MKNVTLTLPQWRMLKRIVNGEILPVSNYRHEHSTVSALLRKKLVRESPGPWDSVAEHWLFTKLGRDAILGEQPS